MNVDTEILSVKPDNHRRHYCSNFVTPEIIGFFSVNEEGHMEHNLSQLKFVKDKFIADHPDLSPLGGPFDLTVSYNETIHKDREEETNEKLKYLETFLVAREEELKFSFVSKVEDAKFFCNRGLLKCILCIPYTSEPLRIVATLFKTDIYLCMLDTDQQKINYANKSEKNIKCEIWGHKFEQFLSSGNFFDYN